MKFAGPHKSPDTTGSAPGPDQQTSNGRMPVSHATSGNATASLRLGWVPRKSNSRKTNKPPHVLGLSFSFCVISFQIMYSNTSSASDEIAVPGTPPMS